MFDLDELQERTSAETYSRGRKLFQENKVINLKKTADKVTAEVLGQHKYQVVLESGEFIQNSCTCPAAEYQDFCKHCVAVALAASSDESEVAAKGTVTDETIKNWLLGQGPEYLADALMGYITRDADEYELWHQRYILATTRMDAKDTGKMITAALPLKDIWEYRKVFQYFEQAEAKLLPLIDGIDELEPELRFKLLDKLLARFNKALQRVDDSAGYRVALESTIIEHYLSAFKSLEWKPAQKAKYLVENTYSSHDIFPDLPDDFALSPEDHKLYVAGCHEKLVGLAGEGQDEESDVYWAKHRLANVVIEDARERDDFDTELQIRILCAGDNCYDCLDISQLYLKLGEFTEAEHWLAKARKLAEGPHYHIRCDRVLIDLYLAQGDKEAAWKIQWGHFEQNPGYQQFKRLVELAEKCDKSINDFSEKVEQGLLNNAEHKIGSRRYYTTEPFDDVVLFYLFTEQFDKAVTFCQERRIGESVLLRLADKVMAYKPREAVTFYQRVMIAVAQKGSNQAYEEVCELVYHLRKQLQLFGQPEDFRPQLEKLMAVPEVKRKRNLMKLLAEKFDL